MTMEVCRNRFATFLCAAVLAVGLGGASPALAADDNVLFILDASGSMWAEMGDGHRITVAREALDEVVADLPEGTPLGLVAYGHRRKGDCDDIEVLIEPGAGDREAFLETVRAINPKGMTPISASVEQAVETLRTREGRGTLVLLSDGLENCDGDPCAAVRAAQEAGLDFVMHVIGFALGDADPSQLQCMAEAGGGRYLPADSATELTVALGEVVERLPGLVLEVVANGDPAPARAYVYRAGTDEEIARGRVGETPGPPYRNPLRIDLPPGEYDVQVVPMTIDGHPGRRLARVTVPPEGEVERRVDFSSGELEVHITANGEPIRARTYVYHAGTDDEAARARADGSGPARYTLPAGDYRIHITPDGIAAPKQVIEDVTVTVGETVVETLDFSTGELEVSITANGEPIRARTYVYHADTDDEAARGRADASGPARYTLPAGDYRIHITPDGIAAPKQVIEDVTVAASDTRRETLDFAVGRLEVLVTVDGAPLDARTYVTRAETGEESDRGRTDQDGRVAYKPLPVGQYQVRVRPDGIDAPDRMVEDVMVTAGERALITVEFSD